MQERKTLWDYGAYAPGPVLKGHVLVGVDGSAEAIHALDRATAEARARSAPLEILHGWPWAKHGTAPALPDGESTPSLVERAYGVLESAVERVRERAPGVDVTATLSPEPAARELVRRGADAALTVLGHRGPGETAGLLTGSVGARVAAQCTGPLLVVRGEGAYGLLEHGTMLVGVADDTDTEGARFAFEQARQQGAQVRVLHACSLPAALGGPPAARPERAQTARTETELRTMARRQAAVPGAAVSALREKFPGVEVETDTVWGGAAGALVDATREADTVVITMHHRHGGRPGAHLGPVTHALLRHAHCPVVLVPAG